MIQQFKTICLKMTIRKSSCFVTSYILSKMKNRVKAMNPTKPKCIKEPKWSANKATLIVRSQQTKQRGLERPVSPDPSSSGRAPWSSTRRSTAAQSSRSSAFRAVPASAASCGALRTTPRPLLASAGSLKGRRGAC